MTSCDLWISKGKKNTNYHPKVRRERFVARDTHIPDKYSPLHGEPAKELRIEFPNHLIDVVSSFGSERGIFGGYQPSPKWMVLLTHRSVLKSQMNGLYWEI